MPTIHDYGNLGIARRLHEPGTTVQTLGSHVRAQHYLCRNMVAHKVRLGALFARFLQFSSAYLKELGLHLQTQHHADCRLQTANCTLQANRSNTSPSLLLLPLFGDDKPLFTTTFPLAQPYAGPSSPEGKRQCRFERPTL